MDRTFNLPYYKGNYYEIVSWGCCKQCDLSTSGRWLGVIPVLDSKFCMSFCKIDHTRNHWRKVKPVESWVRRLMERKMKLSRKVRIADSASTSNC